MERIILKDMLKEPGKPDIGIKIVVHKFTPKEKEDLLSNLKKHDAKQTDKFIKTVEYICNEMLHLEESPNFQSLKVYAEPIIANFKKSIEYLKDLQGGYLSESQKIHFYHEKSIIGIGFRTPQDENSFDDLNIGEIPFWDFAKNIEGDLSKLVIFLEKNLEYWKGTPGRPSADSKKFSISIALAYYDCFGLIPTTYEDGSFFRTVASCLKILKLKNIGAERMVRDAVKNVKEMYDKTLPK